jgi:hypothetical protein
MDNYSPINNNNMNTLLDNQITNQLNSQFNSQFNNQPNVSEHYSQQATAPQVQQTPVQQMPLIAPSVKPPQPPARQPANPVQQAAVPVPDKKLGGQAEQLLKGVLSRSTKMILFYIVLSVSLMCAYAWSEAMKGIVKKYLTLSNHSEVDNIIYASVITLVVVVFVQILELAGANVSDIALKNIVGVIQ